MINLMMCGVGFGETTSDSTASSCVAVMLEDGREILGSLVVGADGMALGCTVPSTDMTEYRSHTEFEFIHTEI